MSPRFEFEIPDGEAAQAFRAFAASYGLGVTESLTPQEEEQLRIDLWQTHADKARAAVEEFSKPHTKDERMIILRGVAAITRELQRGPNIKRKHGFSRKNVSYGAIYAALGTVFTDALPALPPDDIWLVKRKKTYQLTRPSCFDGVILPQQIYFLIEHFGLAGKPQQSFRELALKSGAPKTTINLHVFNGILFLCNSPAMRELLFVPQPS